MRNIEEYSAKYMEMDFENYQVHFQRKMLLERIAKYDPQTILEVGCALEPLFLFVPDTEFTICEPSEQFIENARRLAAKQGRNVRFVQGFLENKLGSLEGRHFDMILCSSLLHEVEQPKRLLETLLRLCDRDSIVHVNVPNARSMHRLIARECGMISDLHEKSENNLTLQQKAVFDMDSLLKLLKDCGIKRVLDKGTYFVKPFTHEQMQAMLDRGIIKEEILDGLYRIISYMPELGSELFVEFTDGC